MDGRILQIRKVRRDASIAFLEAFLEGRPVEELRDSLPGELEATGQTEAARIVRSFFHLPGITEVANIYELRA